jgi:signal transduction histidine kinase
VRQSHPSDPETADAGASPADLFADVVGGAVGGATDAAHSADAPSPAAALAASPIALVLRELGVVREIARALHAADRPEELYRFAPRPRVPAARGGVRIRVRGGRVVGPHAPRSVARLAGAVRAVAGRRARAPRRGPSGEAAAERRVIEVPDVYADEALADWQDVARELGIRAMVALPLVPGGALVNARRVLGAVTFYFADPSHITDAQRALLRVVADQLADAAEKARSSTSCGARTPPRGEQRRAGAAVRRRARSAPREGRVPREREPRAAHAARRGDGLRRAAAEDLSGPLMPAQRRDLTQVQAASERLLDLIDNLIELTTLKRGGLDVHAEEFDPRTPLHEALARVTNRPPAVALRVDEPTTVLRQARTDRKKTVKILVSLLTNAFKFTASGEVRASVEVRDGRVAYRVQDTGIGIPADAQQMVFDEFRQVDGSAARRYGGSGLGLALARRLARLLGGDIDLVSEVGVGSTFVVELPLEYVAPADPALALPTPAYGMPRCASAGPSPLSRSAACRRPSRPSSPPVRLTHSTPRHVEPATSHAPAHADLALAGRRAVRGEGALRAAARHLRRLPGEGGADLRQLPGQGGRRS